MSKYTTEVRYICEYYAGLDESTDFTDVDDTITAAQDSIFQEYPIFDEAYRDTLNHKILKHYYTREIGLETVGLWKLKLNTRLQEIMPYYNKLYESELLKFNPLYDVDITTSHTGNENKNENASTTTSDERKDARTYIGDTERTGTETSESASESKNDSNSTSTSNSESSGNNTNNANSKSTNAASGTEQRNSTDKYSDTPQGGLYGIENDTYLTNARLVENVDVSTQNGSQNAESSGSSEFAESGSSSDISATSGKEESSQTGTITNNDKTTNSVTENNHSSHSGDKNENRDINTTEAYLEHVSGKRSGISYAKLLKEFRDTFLNIDMMIISNLSDLFFGLWE